ncbi:ABC transporter substrate-binding protein [uncultured Enterovirga sp.]|uniref:ABC transporter substrate-binding protein n=1 Tax=uncultured Enterovirga sp. TaxID=2026352 RepID=UPI0035CBFAFE
MNSIKALLGATALAIAMVPMAVAMAQTATVRIMTTETNPNTKQVLESVVADYEKANPGTKIEVQYVGFQDLTQKLMAAVAAGEPPEVFNVQNQYETFELARRGITRPVDGIVERVGRADYFEPILKANSLDGKVWSVPFSTGVNVLWYRKDLYEKHGLKEAGTWAEYLHNLETLSKAEGEGGRFYGTAMAVGANWLTNDIVQNWMWSNGATIFDKDGEVTLNKPNAVATFEFLAKLTAFAPPGMNNYSNNEMMNAFATGAVGHTDYPFRLLSYLEQFNPALLNVAVPMLHPVGTGEGAHPAALLYVKSWAFAKGAKNQKQADDFITYLETGDRKVRMMKTVPVHYWPPLKSVAESQDFLNQPLFKTPAGERSLAVLRKAIEIGQLPLSESGVPVLKLGPVLQRFTLARALEQVVIRKMPPAKAVEAAVETLK